jgi:hypothetical protein
MDDSPFDAYTIFISFMSLTVIIRHYNHRKFFRCFADVRAVGLSLVQRNTSHPSDLHLSLATTLQDMRKSSHEKERSRQYMVVAVEKEREQVTKKN